MKALTGKDAKGAKTNTGDAEPQSAFILISHDNITVYLYLDLTYIYRL